jgi:hypothetical protein
VLSRGKRSPECSGTIVARGWDLCIRHWSKWSRCTNHRKPEMPAAVLNFQSTLLSGKAWWRNLCTVTVNCFWNEITLTNCGSVIHLPYRVTSCYCISIWNLRHFNASFDLSSVSTTISMNMTWFKREFTGYSTQPCKQQRHSGFYRQPGLLCTWRNFARI